MASTSNLEINQYEGKIGIIVHPTTKTATSVLSFLSHVKDGIVISILSLCKVLKLNFTWLLELTLNLTHQSCGTSPDSEESVLLQLASVPSTGSLSSRASRLSHSAMSILAATLTTKADVVRSLSVCCCLISAVQCETCYQDEQMRVAPATVICLYLSWSLPQKQSVGWWSVWLFLPSRRP